MKILLLGKNGLLASEVNLAFSRVHQIFSFGHDEVDITDTKKVSERIGEVKPDFVVNATGYTKVDQAEEEQELAFQINGRAVGELAKICAAKKIPLMHFSTDYVFTGINKNGYREDAPLENPLNIYGESKLLGEKLLMENTPYYFLIRSQWLYGAGGKNFVQTMLELCKTQQAIRVVNDQFGKPTYVKDLAQALLLFFNSNKYGIYHIVNEGITSWFEYAKEILKLAGIKKEVTPITTEELNRPAKRPKYSAMINSKLPLLRPWRQALEEYILHTPI